MDTREKSPAKPIKNYRIRFRDEDQLAVIRKAAARHGISFNRLVIEASERTAIALLKVKRSEVNKVLDTAMLEAFPVEE